MTILTSGPPISLRKTRLIRHCSLSIRSRWDSGCLKIFKKILVTTCNTTYNKALGVVLCCLQVPFLIFYQCLPHVSEFGKVMPNASTRHDNQFLLRILAHPIPCTAELTQIRNIFDFLKFNKFGPSQTM
ncbi:hypothetical protein HZS_2854 [Henneguya salminicola]|nr:hypothetical protein HZS_2854 [Henneguya salminicola]